MADSKLNSNLALRRAFDPNTDKLNVSAEVTATIGNVNVVIDATSDNIAIKNSTTGNELAINPDGTLNANVIVDRNSDSITTFAGDESFRLDDTSTPNMTYYGYAVAGASPSSSIWKIFRIDETSGMVKQYADGNTNYDNSWNNRTSLTYI